ncbi:hypothetical protein N7E81_09565 [Reichenbachiella carrageenanivorans]|uniref:Lipocalin-like domain-containing protein n=1 Tax=Reichenbachiella carrageenanivorans TaxID=2979869 RepID=A0ABY6D166_9BACT|nr:hypothetical protein [Reichenbachiella carrageenanivorans]UXX77615.1 hypothetical protein N7E81_09565 [Reichenbachiella carrageenanivorans]
MATLDNHYSFIGLVLLMFLAQCGVKDISRSLDDTQTNRLLSAGDEKSWVLVRRIEDGSDVFGSCLEDNVLTFVDASAVDSLYLMGRVANCGGASSVDTLYKAEYTMDVDDSDVFQNTISLTEEQHASIGLFSVDDLTSTSLKLTYTLDGKQIVERYTY